MGVGIGGYRCQQTINCFSHFAGYETNFRYTRDYIVPYIVHCLIATSFTFCHLIRDLKSEIIPALCDKTVHQTLFSDKIRQGLSIVLVLDVHVHLHQYFVSCKNWLKYYDHNIMVTDSSIPNHNYMYVTMETDMGVASYYGPHQ